VRWRNRRRSDNIEDRRGVGRGRGPRLPVRRGRVAGPGGLIGIAVVVVIALALGVDPLEFLAGSGEPGPGQDAAPRVSSAQEEELKAFVSVVLADTEDSWHALFADAGRAYREPHLVLFSGAVDSACGFAGAAVGPFYCARDERVYLDLGFFGDLERKLGAPGDFAQAYVIAHEVGHHVQAQLGVLEEFHALRGRMDEADYNALSVRVELQADCFAGLWANHVNRDETVLEPGDIKEALDAASAIGDDRLQRQAQGYVVPDSFTHGTSAQRVRWFTRGFEGNGIAACDTFAADAL